MSPMIYFIQNGDFVKIGITFDVKARLAIFQMASPLELKVMRLINGSEELESYLHRRLSKYNVRGEWFLLNAEVIATMNSFPHLSSEEINSSRKPPKVPNNLTELSVRETALSLNYTQAYIFILLSQKRFPNAFKRNKRWFIPPEDVESYRAAAADWKRR